MKITVGRLVDSEVVSTYQIKVWTAARWTLNNNNLTQVLEDKAYESAGITPSILYKSEMSMWGAGAQKSDKDWTFEVKITRRKWEEVTE